LDVKNIILEFFNGILYWAAFAVTKPADKNDWKI
jgi:hypothetical protein